MWINILDILSQSSPQHAPKQPSKYLVDPTTSNSKVLRVKTSQISRRPDRNQIDSEYEAQKSSRNP